ncbi:CvpA family protein [Mycoplasmatota bacterium]|nr:CvpA family protein [Mycoplasmatota bacterium]
MEIHVDFDLILIAIFITIFITGYIRGGGIELLRVLKVVIPFFVLYFYGDAITNLLFSNQKTIQFVYAILPDIAYRNTIAALSSQIGVYIIVYTFLAIFLWRLGKFVLDERIEYIFGRFNSILGGIFSVIRMYIIISVFIIPFYALNFTNYSDPLTSFVLDHPPNFSRLGLLIDKSKPTVDKFNEVSAALKIMDVKSLEKYTLLVNDVEDFVVTNEHDAYSIYEHLKNNDLIEGEYTQSEFLYYYVNHRVEFRKMNFSNQKLNEVNRKLNHTVEDYEQVFIWVYEKNILDMTSNDQIISSFIENYPQIAADTHDQLTVEILSKMKLKTQLYLILKNWFMESYQIEIQSDFDLLNDQNLALILDDFSLHKDQLTKSINQMDAKDFEKEDIIKQIERFSDFQQEYIKTYKPKINLYDQILDDVSFKYKLAFAIMKEKKFNQVVDSEMEEDSLMYLFSLDSLDFINYFSHEDDQIYYEAGQVYVALFLIDIKPDQQIEKITYDKMIKSLEKFTVNDDLFKRTKPEINEIIKALLINHNDQSYIEFLIESDLCEEDLINQMVESKEMKSILTGENYILLKNINQKIQSELS